MCVCCAVCARLKRLASPLFAPQQPSIRQSTHHACSAVFIRRVIFCFFFSVCLLVGRNKISISMPGRVVACNNWLTPFWWTAGRITCEKHRALQWVFVLGIWVGFAHKVVRIFFESNDLEYLFYSKMSFELLSSSQWAQLSVKNRLLGRCLRAPGSRWPRRKKRAPPKLNPPLLLGNTTRTVSRITQSGFFYR